MCVCDSDGGNDASMNGTLLHFTQSPDTFTCRCRSLLMWFIPVQCTSVQIDFRIAFQSDDSDWKYLTQREEEHISVWFWFQDFLQIVLHQIWAVMGNTFKAWSLQLEAWVCVGLKIRHRDWRKVANRVTEAKVRGVFSVYWDGVNVCIMKTDVPTSLLSPSGNKILQEVCVFQTEMLLLLLGKGQCSCEWSDGTLAAFDISH